MVKLHVLLLHVNRPRKLLKCILSLFECKVDLKIVLLQQGSPSFLTKRILDCLSARGNLIKILDRNVGIGPGRELLKKLALEDGCEYAFYLDDDIYVNRRVMVKGLEVLDCYDVVGFPQISPSGRLISPGGYRLVIKGNVLRRYWPFNEVYDGRIFEVDGVNAGCMICSVDALRRMCFGPYISGFDDLEKSLHILDLRQCIVPIPVIHDRDVKSAYAKIRYGRGVLREAYLQFMGRVGLRLPLKDHLYYLSPPYAYLYDLFKLIREGLSQL